MRCGEIMTSNPKYYCVPSDLVTKVARVMNMGDVGALPVCDDRQGNKLVGIVTDRDLAVKVVAEARDPSTTRVQDIMTREPLACKADDDVVRAMDCMSLYQVRRIPVVGDRGELIGIISQADVAIRAGRPEKTAEVVGDISSRSTYKMHEGAH